MDMFCLFFAYVAACEALCAAIAKHARRNGPVREGAAAAAAPGGFFLRGNIAACAA
jgi:hypothetical protein